MSTLTMPFPHHHTGFHREFSWQEPRPSEFSRPRNEPEKIALPSIRQASKPLFFSTDRQTNMSAGFPRAPITISGPTGALTPPEYTHTSIQSKRRRPSFDDEREGRPSQVPRLYASSSQMISRHQSPPLVARAAPELWASSGRTSPYMNGALPSMRSPRVVDFRERMEPRLSLPSLPQMDYERSAAMSRMRSISRDDYVQEPVGQVIPHQNMAGPPMEAPPPVYRSYDYPPYHHPTRVQSLSLGSLHPLDRTPFAPGAYGHAFQDTYMRIGELGMGMGGDNKQRKRRGNLPKETTDKLRSWFVAHLHHPYPTEDEKQELMRQTGLQMSKLALSKMFLYDKTNRLTYPLLPDQISNWFINARRRQLPTMVSNARAESEAMASRGGDSKVLPSTERGEYEHDGKRASVPLSDGEGSTYDEVDMDALSRRRSANMKRGSI
ncbi:homeobox domain-containing protein [Seiridium cupressi]